MSITFPDTIIAQATPPGRGGIAILRISGPKVKDLITSWLNCQLRPRQATYLPFKGSNGEILDEGIAIFFPHPHSFTGEDVLELQGHGGPIVNDLLLQHILTFGVRLARPGEFSERAFLNGKMDLVQAEAIADLINASSEEAARLAMRSLQGMFSKRINELRDHIIHLRTLLEASVDFAEEDINVISDAALMSELQKIFDSLKHLTTHAQQGCVLREGITVVIVGEPNVGKSTLLNCLSGKELAIVTDIPGTTRDVLRSEILIEGLPVHLIDTAGLRESKDVIEKEGIKRAYHEIEQADIILYVVDACMPSLKPPLFQSKNVIMIQNKIDLTKELPRMMTKNNQTTISLSAQTGKGVDLLCKQIRSYVEIHKQPSEGTFLARRRHLDALSRTYSHIEKSLIELLQSGARELIAENLRLAQLSLNEITGEFSADDLLGNIFSTFCIGK